MAKKAKQVIYHVSAVPRPDFPGFWRSGIFFPNAPAYVALTEAELTEAIRNERMLLIRRAETDEDTGEQEDSTQHAVSADSG